MKDYFWKKLEEPEFESDSGHRSGRTVLFGEEREVKKKDKQKPEQKDPPPPPLKNDSDSTEDAKASSPGEEIEAELPDLETVETAECTILQPKPELSRGTAEEEGDLPEMKDDCQ